MTIRTRIVLITALITLFAGVTFASTQSKEHTGKVLESLDGGGYTYLRVEENKKEYWIAGPLTSIKVGTTVTFSEQIWMPTFTSKALNRTFDRLMFVGSINTNGAVAKTEFTMLPKPIFKETPRASAKDAGTFTIAELYARKAELYARKAELEGKLITVRGKVVKVSPNIMGKTWVHIQDGTGKEGTDKIIFTSKNQTALIGTDVTAQGVVNLDVDLGSGYFYSILIEESTFSNK